MNTPINCRLDTFDYQLDLFDTNKLRDSNLVKNYQILRLESLEDGSFDTDSLFISTFTIEKPTVNLRVNLIAEIIKQDNKYYIINVKFNVKGYEFYDVHEVLYLLKDIVHEITPEDVEFEITSNVEYKVSN